jgi:hypothetical protein
VTTEEIVDAISSLTTVGTSVGPDSTINLLSAAVRTTPASATRYRSSKVNIRPKFTEE